MLKTKWKIGSLALALMTILILPPQETLGEDSESNDIEFICQKERERIESVYRANKQECEAVTDQYSVERLMKDPDVIQAAHDSTKAHAQLESLDWPPKKKGWWIFKVEVPRTEPWKDPLFDYQKHYNYYLRKIAEQIGRPHLENARLSKMESEQAYEQALARLDQECKRRKELHQDNLKLEQEKQVLGIRKSIEQERANQGHSLKEFVDKIEDYGPKDNSIVVKPGRFDAQRKRWDVLGPSKVYDPRQSLDSRDSSIINGQEAKD